MFTYTFGFTTFPKTRSRMVMFAGKGWLIGWFDEKGFRRVSNISMHVILNLMKMNDQNIIEYYSDLGMIYEQSKT